MHRVRLSVAAVRPVLPRAVIERRAEATRENRGGTALGWAPLLSIVTAAGLLAIAIADTLGRQDLRTEIGPLFWLGIGLITIPSGLRLLARSATRRERIVLVVMLGVGLYLIKVLHDPLMFTFFDEFLHVRTVDDIARTGHLFTPNPLLQVSPYYPGLESVTSAVTSLSGASTFVAGTVILGIARVLLVLVLFLLFETIGRSTRLAGVATFVYMANASFLFFSSQFAYESLGVPLALFAIYLIVRRQAWLDKRPVSWVLIGVTVAAVVVTHHITSIVLVGLLFGWTLVALAMRWWRRPHGPPIMPALLVGGATVAWLLVVATVTVGYLAPAVQTAALQVVQLLIGEGQARQLFKVTNAPAPSPWEQLAAYAAQVILLVGIPLGIWALRRTVRATPMTVVLCLAALAYPGTLLARLTERGAELSARSTAFLFLALGFVVAAALAGPVPALSIRWSVEPRWRLALRAVPLVIVMIGGVAVADPVWGRLPGTYLVAADTRSIEPIGIAAAQWAVDNLGRDNRFMADRTNSLLLATIGDQHPVSASADHVNIRPAFFDLQLGTDAVDALEAGRIQYVLIDRRLSSALPLVGIYVEPGEAEEGPRRVPIDPAALGKFDGAPSVSRVYDNGAIQLYDVRTIVSAAPQTP